MLKPFALFLRNIVKINDFNMSGKQKSHIFLSTLILGVIAIAFTLFTSVNTKSSSKKSSRLENKISKKSFSKIRKAVFKIPTKDNKVIFNHHPKCFGIDVSHYQENIDWSKVKKINDLAPVSFVMMRATYGKNKVDEKFSHNWKEAKKQNLIRGAYHYYRPNEDSNTQVRNFISNVRLQKGDFPPILDVEKAPKRRQMSAKKFEKGLLNWLKKVELHYGVKPIIYTSDGFLKHHLTNEEFKNYTIWIANYNDVKEPNHKNWKFWQFSDKGKVEGISTKVDLNVFNGNDLHLLSLLIK